MPSSSSRFARDRLDLLTDTASDLLREMEARIRALCHALDQSDEAALAASQTCLPLLRDAVARLNGRQLDAAALAALSAAVRALPAPL